MRTKTGLTEKELAEANDISWLYPDGKVPDDYELDADCDFWKYKFYAMKKGQYVIGFDNEEDCKNYCKENKYTSRSFEKAIASIKKPNKIANWADSYSMKGII